MTASEVFIDACSKAALQIAALGIEADPVSALMMPEATNVGAETLAEGAALFRDVKASTQAGEDR